MSKNKSKRGISGFGVQYDKRDRLYADMLEKCVANYVAKTGGNAVFKNIFFYVTLVLLCAMIIIPLFLLFTVATKESTSLADVAAVIGSAASIVSSVMIIPKIIAEHLFPANEDVYMNELLRNMQENDTKIRERMTSEDGGNNRQPSGSVKG